MAKDLLSQNVKSSNHNVDNTDQRLQLHLEVILLQ